MKALVLHEGLELSVRSGATLLLFQVPLVSYSFLSKVLLLQMVSPINFYIKVSKPPGPQSVMVLKDWGIIEWQC